MTVRVAVVGAGNMGRNHVRCYAGMDSVVLAGVADSNPQSLRTVCRNHHVEAFSDYKEMFVRARPDAVSIVVPTVHHLKVALDAMERGISVLVEKPIALNVEAAIQMVEAAQKYGVKLMVGHIERFNPAVREMARRLRANELGRVFQIHARRHSPFPARIVDVGVTMDLATHDIDVMRHLLASNPSRVYAEFEQRAHQSAEDILSGLIRFECGVIGVLDVNWLTPTKVRQLSVLGERGMYVADYITQDFTYYHNSHEDGDWQALGVFRGVSEGDILRPHIAKREPLWVELDSFIRSVAENTSPEVTGEDGLENIRIATMLAESARTHQAVFPESKRSDNNV